MAGEEASKQSSDIISCKCTPLAVTWLKLSLTIVFPLEEAEGQGSVEKLGHRSVIKQPRKTDAGKRKTKDKCA